MHTFAARTLLPSFTWKWLSPMDMFHRRPLQLLPLSGECCSRHFHHGYRQQNRHTNLVTYLPIKAEKFSSRIAVVDQHGIHTYDKILYLSHQLADTICDKLSTSDLKNRKVAFAMPNDVSFLITLWGIWLAGGDCVPLYPSHPKLDYFIKDSQSELVICAEEYEEKLSPIAANLEVPLHVKHTNAPTEGKDNSVHFTTHVQRQNKYNQLQKAGKLAKRSALIVYTSGTTGPPKGVVHTYGSLHSQMSGMLQEWEWNHTDVILHTLPLHHVHGLVNALMTPLSVGATCVMMPKFDPAEVWSKLLSAPSQGLPRSVNIFMAVPTIYVKLIENYDLRFGHLESSHRARDYVKAVCQSKFRLMVSGSSALPAPVMKRWEEITGHRLLERYGMTETGMVLTNPLNGQRVTGAVGYPFPGVRVRIAKLNRKTDHKYEVLCEGSRHGTMVTPGCEEEAGELLVKGHNLFKEYWKKSAETLQELTSDGWFKTGDTAVYASGVFKILGRTSVDIIKSGGYKISALQIEQQLLQHPDIQEVAVVGLPDLTWGQKVAAIIMLKPDCQEMNLADLKSWCSTRLPTYQVPTAMKIVTDLNRNALGKVDKKKLLNDVFGKEVKMKY